MAEEQAGAVAAEPQAEVNSGVLRMRGLPFAATEADVREFFKPASEPAAVFVCKRNGEVPLVLLPACCRIAREGCLTLRAV